MRRIALLLSVVLLQLTTVALGMLRDKEASSSPGLDWLRGRIAGSSWVPGDYGADERRSVYFARGVRTGEDGVRSSGALRTVPCAP
jgi:hypothetical protein